MRNGDPDVMGLSAFGDNANDFRPPLFCSVFAKFGLELRTYRGTMQKAVCLIDVTRELGDPDLGETHQWTI